MNGAYQKLSRPIQKWIREQGWSELREIQSQAIHIVADSEDDLIVFYVPNRSDWSRLVERAVRAGFHRVKSCNPYWDEDGVTLEDPDGYRMVLQNGEWAV